ncbi:Replication factor C subunit 5 [Strongyloides ratti]|uniref:Replication factor C subunit 5 n=1 Tax=Strongyloides ratti TaxID=34506 RepID=A0A090LDF6_STRRB|nr:Replication factor C subunit 5 [Strongyloides ratti]CEF67821.1 Replication factor C subunit 5 [Strongyloides ratti]
MTKLLDMVESKNLPWVEKYRPDTLDDLVSHKEIVNTLTKLIDDKKLPHLLFYGPPGTGKTSTILAAAKRIYPSQKYLQTMVLELNASDDRGIGVVRDEIINFAQTKTLHSIESKKSEQYFKLVILDEADAMTKEAQGALRRVIEKFTDNVRFCIICNYLSKIIPAIQSRCTRFRFTPVDPSLIGCRLRLIVKQEKVDIDDDGEKALMNLCGGDMRRVLNILQSTHLAFGKVTEDNVYNCVGQPNPKLIENMLKILMNDDLNKGFKAINEILLNRGFALTDLIGGMLDLLLRLELAQDIIAHLIEQIAIIDKRLTQGSDEKVQLAALVSLFYETRVEKLKV